MVDSLIFSKWLERELETRKITQSELARQAGVTRAAINGILSGARGPGIDLCQGIARAFRLPPEEVYRAAGILPPEPTETTLARQITYLTNQLPHEEQQGILEFIKLRLRLAEERGKYETRRPAKQAGPTK